VSEEKINPKTYKHFSTRVLNRTIKKREQQIAAVDAGNPTTTKNLAQLRYELEQMVNELMERSITRSSETKEHQPEKK